MITEELKTFINKMRVAGKTDPEITTELKTAGWSEADINQELSSKTSKTRFNLGKIKFWLWLYGISILLFLALSIFSKDSWLSIDSWAGIFIQIYIFGVVPIFTFITFGLKLLFWLLRCLPYFKRLEIVNRTLNHQWIMVIASIVTALIMLWVGYQTRGKNGESEAFTFYLFSILGGLWLILSFIFALVLIVIRKIVRRKKIGFQVN